MGSSEVSSVYLVFKRLLLLPYVIGLKLLRIALLSFRIYYGILTSFTNSAGVISNNYFYLLRFDSLNIECLLWWPPAYPNLINDLFFFSLYVNFLLRELSISLVLDKSLLFVLPAVFTLDDD